MTKARKLSSPALVAVVGFVIVAVLVLRALTALDWDATVFVGFGEEATPTRAYAEERLGEVFLRVGQGHDGKFFFVQANDPWLVEPVENAEVLDLPLYRSQRMLYPMLAGGSGLLGPEQIVWGLLVTNLVAIALGTWGTAVVAQRIGVSPWLGLAFAFNIGFISSVTVSGAGILAAAAAFWAVAALLDGRSYPAIVLLAAAALTREVMLVAALGAAWWLWKQGRRRIALATVLIPASVVGVWALYLRLRLDGDQESVGVVGLPLVGLAKAVPEWMGDPVALLAGFGMILLLVLYTRQVFRSQSLLGWTFLGFIPLAILFTDMVWVNWFDFTRVIAPVITAFVLLVFVGSGANRGGGADSWTEEPSSEPLPL